MDTGHSGYASQLGFAQFAEIHAHKKSPHFCSEGETHLLLNIMKDLDINRFLNLHKNRNTNLFKKLVEGIKEVRAVRQVRHCLR